MRRRKRCTTQVSNDMNRLVLVTTMLLFAVPVSAEEVNETLDASADGKVEIYNTAGSVTVEGWSRNAVEVTGTLGDEVEKFVFERKGDSVVVKVKPKKNQRSGGRSTSSYITVRVPQRSSLEVSTISAEIDVEGVEGEQELQSVSGSVSTQVFAAEIEVEEWAAPNGSYSLSLRLVKPDRPPPWRKVRIRSRRPVRILWG